MLGGNADYFTHEEEGGDKVLYEGEKRVDRPGCLTDLLGDEAIAWLGRPAGAKPFFL